MKYSMIIWPFFLLVSCNEIQQQAVKHSIVEPTLNHQIVNPKGNTLATRFIPPAGYTRTEENKDSYAAFLRNVELKPHGTLVHLYDGREKHNKVADAILSYDVGSLDLQQCADAVMRIRAEYLYSRKKFDAIHFNFTNGFNAEYNRWRQGERISVNGNSCKWIKTSSPDHSYHAFRTYLNKVYSFAGSLSLSKELQKVSDLQNVQSGDVFIIGGSPGHAVTVMDIAVNKAGEKVFMLSQSYMPAQDIHILKNMEDPSLSPWYKVNDIKTTLETPEYTFEPQHLMRFKD